ncbi:MAG: helix-turn-helix domain-containing protein [Flavobacteriales bacterium]|nr:helix-turn-helix domain-containing protein [Flavobacteriales bacterium]
MEAILLNQVSPEQLSELIVLGIRDELQKLKENFTSKKVNDELLTKKQVCKMLQCSTVTLWHWENKGILIPTRTGRLVRYKKNDIENFINSKTKENEINI